MAYELQSNKKKMEYLMFDEFVKQSSEKVFLRLLVITTRLLKITWYQISMKNLDSH